MTYGIQQPDFQDEYLRKRWFGNLYEWAEANTKSVAATTDHTVQWDEHLIRADASGGSITITLPPITDAGNNPLNIGRPVIVVKVDSSDNIVKVQTFGGTSDLINGVATQSLSQQWASLYLKASGSGVWDRLDNHIRDILSLHDLGGVGDGTTSAVTPINSAITKARTIYVPKGTWLVDSNVTITDDCELWIENGAQISVANTKTLTYEGKTLRAPLTKIFAGSGTVLLTNIPDVHVEWWGAVGSHDIADAATNTAAIQKAVNCAQNSGIKSNVCFGPGMFYINDQITTATNRGVAFIGHRDSAMQNGNVHPVSSIRWSGGAEAMFLVESSYTNFSYLSFDCDVDGSATAVFDITDNGAGQFILNRCTFSSGEADPNSNPLNRPFSSAIIQATRVNYSEVRYCEFVACAPKIWAVDGTGTTNGMTTLYFHRNQLDTYFDCQVIYVKNSSYDLVVIDKNTFNIQPVASFWQGLGYEYTTYGHCIFDSTDCNLDATGKDIANLVIKDNEWDNDEVLLEGARIALLNRCRNVEVSNLSVTGDGVQTGGIQLTDSIVSHTAGILWASIPGPFFDLTDADSRVWSGFHQPRNPNGTKVVNDDSSSGTVDLFENGTNLFIYGHKGHPFCDTTYSFTANDATNYTVKHLLNSDNPPSYLTRGQKLTVEIINGSGGAMGTITFDSSQFELTGPFKSPADGCRRKITFEWDGEKLREHGPRNYFDVGAGTNKTIDDGTYTPTATIVANVDAVTTYQSQYMRVGKTVTGSGKIDIDATAATTTTTVRITLPIASDLANAEDCGGTIAASGGLGYGRIGADTTNNEAQLILWPTGTGNTTYFYQFTYRIP